MYGKHSTLAKLENKIHRKDCLEFMRRLPGQSIDFCMTSPPYWSLRDYGAAGQIGLERTPEEYIRRLLLTFRELKRILKDTGSFYLNLGDTYFGPDNCSVKSWKIQKQLALIPSRVAIALQEDGWILRNDICWYKPNGLPSSVRDRLTNRWEHVFHFVKHQRYYYDLDAIRVPYKASSIKRARNRIKLIKKTGKPLTKRSKYFQSRGNIFGSNGLITGRSFKRILNPKGANPGDCWNITIKPVSVPHFAVYPEQLCIRPIKSSCPPDGIVFDMFAGSGTTLVAAKKLGRRFIGCDLNSGYVKLAGKRLKSFSG